MTDWVRMRIGGEGWYLILCYKFEISRILMFVLYLSTSILSPPIKRKQVLFLSMDNKTYASQTKSFPTKMVMSISSHRNTTTHFIIAGQEIQLKSE